MNPEPNVPAEARGALLEEIDLRSLIQVLNKWRWLIVLILLLSAVSAALISFFVLEPVYEARTSIMVVQTQQRQVYREAGLGEAVADISRLPEITIQNVIRQIRNPEVMSRTIKALKLDREIYTAEGLLQMTTVTGDTETRGGSSSIIDIRVQHTDPAMAALLANTIREQYLEFVSEKNYEQMSKSLAFLDEQIKEAEKAFADYAQQLKEFDEQPRGVYFLEREIESKLKLLNDYRGTLKQLTIEYEKTLAAAEQLRQKLLETPQFMEVPGSTAAADSGPLPEGGEHDSAPGRQAAPPLPLYEVNPVYLALREALNQKEVDSAGTWAQIAATENMIAQLEGELDRLQAEYTEKKTRREQLVTQLELARRTYELLSEKFVQTKIYQAVDLGETNFLTIAAAQTPKKPIKPNKTLNIAISAVLGLMVGVFLSFFLEMMDTTIKTPDDVYKHLGLPVLGSIPEHRRKAGYALRR